MPHVANPFYAARRRAPVEAPVEWFCWPCWYVLAETGERRIWLSGPFRTRGEAAQVAARSVAWAVHHSGDERARRYEYRLHRHVDGQIPSVLGRLPQ
jgi:hypothetical protein